MNLFYRVVSRDKLDQATDELLVVGRMSYKNPSLGLLHRLGYWPKDPDIPEPPAEEEGYAVFDDGFSYKDDGAGGKLVTRRFRKLRIVDDGYPDLAEGQEIYRDEWVERGDEYVHEVTVLDIVDEPPEVDESTHHLKSKTWRVDLDLRQKVAVYEVVRRVDDSPSELAEGEEFVEDRWGYDTLPDGEEVYRRFTRVMKVVRDVPELAEGEQVVDSWYEDDEETNTRTYRYRVMRVVDEPPVLEEGQSVVDDWWDDDEETNTRTHRYSVRRIVDEPPKLEENDTVEYEWWDDDGVTRTHRYEVHRRVDVPPVLAPGQDIVGDHWEDDWSNPYLVVHTRVYEVRLIVDEPPELDELHFVHHEWWDDDGVTHTHVYDVWELRDDPRPELDESENRIEDLGVVDDPDRRTRGRKWLVRPIVRNKPEDDPDGNFKWVEDGEDDLGDRIEIRYRRVDKVWRRVSKLALEAALFQMGLLDTWDAFIDSIEVENDRGQKVGARRFYNQANELRENHPMFKPYYAAGLKALGLTEEQGDALLEQCAAE